MYKCVGGSKPSEPPKKTKRNSRKKQRPSTREMFDSKGSTNVREREQQLSSKPDKTSAKPVIRAIIEEVSLTIMGNGKKRYGGCDVMRNWMR